MTAKIMLNLLTAKLREYEKLVEVLEELMEEIKLFLKKDGSCTLKLWYEDGKFDMWEKAWTIPRTGEHITKDNKVYEVQKVNYFTGTIWYVEIYVKFAGVYDTGGLLK